MDYTANIQKHIVDGRELRFIRCDKNGNVLSPQQLQALSVTNSTIEALVTEVSSRIITEDGAFSLTTLEAGE